MGAAHFRTSTVWPGVIVAGVVVPKQLVRAGHELAQKQPLDLATGPAQVHAHGYVPHRVFLRVVAVGLELVGIKPLALVAAGRDEIDLLLLGRLVVDNDGPAQAVLPGRDDVAGNNFLAVAGPAGQQQNQQT